MNQNIDNIIDDNISIDNNNIIEDNIENISMIEEENKKMIIITI